MNDLPGVTNAKVNFTAEKITIDGDVSIDEIEKAGSFENLKVRSENAESEDKQPFWKQWKWIQVIISFIFVTAGWLGHLFYGDGHLLTVSLFLVAMLIGGYSMFWQGLKNLSQLIFDMKTLMTIAIIGAAIIGEWGEGALVVVLFAISEALESFSMDRARRSIRSLVETGPKQASVYRDGVEKTVPVEEVEIGETIFIRPGEKIPLDGEVISGSSSVNQAAITGESVPITKNLSDDVFAGTLNEEGLLSIRVTKHVQDTTLATIIHLVEEAQAEKAPAQQFIDRFAAYYTPAIMLLAFFVMIGPPLLMGAPWEQWIYLGLATLVVGCPCALVISTPVAIVTAIGNSAKHGILIKGGVHLEEAGRIKTLAFDKTGTLTRGVLTVTDVKTKSNSEEEVLFQFVYGLEKYSTHPLAKTLVDYAVTNGFDKQEIPFTDVTSLTGKGMAGIFHEQRFFVASPSYVRKEFPFIFSETDQRHVNELQKQGKTVVIVGNEVELLGLIALRDEVRPEAKGAISELMNLGINEVVMLTGDQRYTAEAIGHEAGVTRVESELLPKQKLEKIEQFKKSGQRVAMVGDGMNDAPALARAHLGIAMGGAGTDTALETADVVLMGDELHKLPYLIELSRKSLTIIKQNIAFALGLKALALILVPFGLLTLWIAIIADMGATLLVTFNSLRLIKGKKNKQ